MSVSWKEVTGKLAAIAAAAEHAAATIYHDVASVEAEVTKWESNNPAIAPLIEKGVSLGLAVLARTGLPAGTVVLVAEDVLAGLKVLAAADPSVGGTGSVKP